MEQETSFIHHQKISAETIASRIVPVKELLQTDLDLYEVSKDAETGEHYLHYAYMHRDFSNTGEPESFHYLLPIDSDDVLGMIFGEQGYAYPEFWRKAFCAMDRKVSTSGSIPRMKRSSQRMKLLLRIY